MEEFELILGKSCPNKVNKGKWVKLVDFVSEDTVEVKIYCKHTAGTARNRRISLEEFLKLVG